MATETPASTYLRTCLETFSLYLVPSEPTHHAMTRDHPSHTWLDLFILRDVSMLEAYSKSVAPFVAGHDFTSLQLKFSRPPKISAIITVRPIKHLSSQSLSARITHHLSNHFPGDLCPTHTTTDLPAFMYRYHPPSSQIDGPSQGLANAITLAFDELAPRRTITLSSSKKPWISQDVRGLMRERDCAYRRARHSGTLAHLNAFKLLRSRVCNLIDTGKNRHFAQLLASAPDAKSKWKELRRMGISSPRYPSPFTRFQASDLNRHYAAVSAGSIPLTEEDLQATLNIPLLRPSESFEFDAVDESQVSRVLNAASSKATGPDGLSVPMLQLAAPTITSPLTVIFNTSLNHASYPALWRRAFLSPLAKCANMLSMSDTRPIAMLCETSKMLERLIHDQFSRYLEASGLLDPRQAGFRKGHSTQTALLGVLDDIRLAIDKRMLTVLVLFDFSKAFDLVPHALLLRKLRRLMCSDRVLAWFYAYLSERLQAVVDAGGTVTEWLKIVAGVPQGSVLGPLLFMVFINDLPSILSVSRHMIFADDTQIYFSFPPALILDGIASINRDVTAVVNWANENGLKINFKKTKAIFIGSTAFITRLNLATLPPIIVQGHVIEYVREVRSLGVWISSTLSWTRQVNQVVRNVHGVLHTLRRYRHALSRDLRKSLVESLALPHLDYACAVYHGVDKTRELKLQRTLNACVRFVCGNITRQGHVTPHRISLGWLSATRRRELLLGTLAFNVISHANPSYLAANFSRLVGEATVRASQRRVPHCLTYATPRTEAMKNSFTVTASDLLNSLPPASFDPSHRDAYKLRLSIELARRDRIDWEERVTNEGISLDAVGVR